jgi:hypothetical protein
VIRLPVTAWPLLGLAVVFLVAGCVTPPARTDLPTGFAEYRKSTLFTVVSPEGVSLRVKTTENEPRQSLEFWAEALRLHLQRSGYALVDSGEFQSNVGKGVRYEWVAPVGEEDWVYMTALSVTGDSIVIVEAAGPYEYYQQHSKEIHSSLETLSLTGN